MFNFKPILKTSHAELTDIQTELTNHPNRTCKLVLKDYDSLRLKDIKELMAQKCGLLVFHSDQMAPQTLTQLIDLAKEKGEHMIVDSANLTKSKVKKLLKLKAVLQFGDGCLILEDTIKEHVINFPGQVQIDANTYSNMPDWLTEMESLGAILL